MEQYATIILLLLQALWGLFLLVLGVAVKRLLADLEHNTRATTAVADKLSALNISLLQEFVLKEDWTYIRQRVHDLGDAVNAVVAREALRQQLAEQERRG